MKTDLHHFFDKDEAGGRDPRAATRCDSRTRGTSRCSSRRRRMAGRLSRSSSRNTRRSRNAGPASGESAQTLREVLEFEKALGLRIERLAHYASLQTSEDSSDEENLAREGQLENLFTLIGESQSFVEPEIMAIDDATFEQYLARPGARRMADAAAQAPPAQAAHAFHRGGAPARARASALRGHRETFSQLTNVDMKFGKIVDEKGVERELSQSSLFGRSWSSATRSCGSARGTNSTRSSTRTNSPSPRRSRIRSRPMSSAPAPAIIPAPAEARSFTTTCR